MTFTDETGESVRPFCTLIFIEFYWSKGIQKDLLKAQGLLKITLSFDESPLNVRHEKFFQNLKSNRKCGYCITL